MADRCVESRRVAVDLCADSVQKATNDNRPPWARKFHEAMIAAAIDVIYGVLPRDEDVVASRLLHPDGELLGAPRRVGCHWASHARSCTCGDDGPYAALVDSAFQSVWVAAMRRLLGPAERRHIERRRRLPRHVMTRASRNTTRRAIVAARSLHAAMANNRRGA